MSTSTQKQPALESAVEEAVRIHESRRFDTNTVEFVRSLNLGDYNGSYPNIFVGYGGLRLDTEAEFFMLKHLWSLAREDSNDTAPHVPEPVHWFAGRWAYIITRHIAMREVQEAELLVKTAEALRWLHSKSAPAGTGTIFGPIGNKCYAHHCVFDNGRAPLIFTSLAAVERYLNEGIHRIMKQSIYMRPIADVSFANEKSILSQSYINPRNFGVALDGRPVLLGALSIQAIPQIFVNFTFFRTTGFATDVSKILYDEEEREEIMGSQTMKSLIKVSVYLGRLGDGTLRLDEDGNPLPREKIIR